MVKTHYIPPKIDTTQKIFVIGDVHGCFDTLRELVETQIRPLKDDQIILLGDTINRGSSSKKVLDYLMHLNVEGYKIRCIRGNHEQTLLMAFDCGFEFFENYLEKYNSLDLLDGDLPLYLKFCAEMDYYIETEDYILSHLGFTKSVPTPSNDTRALFHGINIYVEDIDKKQVYGHITKSVNEIKKVLQEGFHQLSIDGGCVFKQEEGLGHLCCLELRSQVLYAQKNIEKD